MLWRSRFVSLCWLMRSPKQDERLLKAFQGRQLCRLIQYASQNVEFYKTRFKQAGLVPETISGLGDLSRVPLISKQDLNSCPMEHLVSGQIDVNRLIERRTSGSSGNPTIVRCTRLEDRLLGAHRFRRIYGKSLGWGVVLARVKILTGFNRSPLPLRFLSRLRILVVADINSLQPIENILAELRRRQPHVIHCYPGLLCLLAQKLPSERRPEIAPRLIVAGGETMTEMMRSRIEEAFKVPTFEVYGAHEVNLIAVQCPESTRLHVCSENVFVEILQEGRPARIGERGEVIVTGLHSFAQPFIRYRLGDTAVRGPDVCQCGHRGMTVEGVEGRLLDWIVFPGNRRRSPDFVFSKLISHSNWVDQFQIIQPDRDTVVLKITSKRDPSLEELSRVDRLMQDFVEGQMQVEVRIVDEIPLEASGKFRISISRIDSNYREENFVRRP